jgi:CDP-diacylglycerol--glycerol-3-phosphate 3-phosphatidyltransferase
MFKPKSPGSIYSEANILTLLRVGACLVFFTLAVVRQDPVYNYIGLFIHWVADWLDGFIARSFKQETLLGAEMDIVADRLEIIIFYVIFLHFRSFLVLPAMLYLVDYAFVDFYLSYQFVKYKIISPNYFYKVDRTVYLLNYSPVGKFVNSSVVTLTLIFLPRIWPAVTVFACGLIGLKTYSAFRLFRLNRSCVKSPNKIKDKE